jgi:NADPH:quinone reductase-like Zn-dependent oxidoreductase
MGEPDVSSEVVGMKAAVIDRFGGPEVFRLADVPVPEPAPGEVLVRTLAAGVNAIDWISRAGHGVAVSAFPAVLGWDICGVVAGRGSGVTALGDGGLVFGMPRFPALAGAYAEYVVAPADQLARVPDGVAVQVAAGAPMAGLTAWQSLFVHGALQRGQRVLVHGAAGGVGHIAVQLARWAGADVTATASGASHGFVLGLGADRVVDYAQVDRLGELDLVIDPRGGSDFARLLGTLRPGGTIVTLKGEAAGQRALAESAGRRAAFTYVGPDGVGLARIAELLASGDLTTTIQQVFGLDDVGQAHRVGEGGHVRGRLVLGVAR